MKTDKKLGGFTKDQIKELRESDFKIKCITCGEEKLSTKFSYGKYKGNGLYYWGYECTHCGYKRRLEKHGHKSASYNATQLYKEANTVEGRAAMLVNRSKQRSKRYNHEFRITKEDIIPRLRNLKCEVTGLPLELGRDGINPYSPSIDRIDNTIGYTPENIQITCMIYNFCKNQFSEDQVKTFLINAGKQLSVHKI